jgi:SNF2 family DNA or RNA helicase
MSILLLAYSLNLSHHPSLEGALPNPPPRLLIQLLVALLTTCSSPESISNDKMEQADSGRSSPLFVPLSYGNDQTGEQTRASNHLLSEPPVKDTNKNGETSNGPPADTPQPNKEQNSQKKSNSTRKRKRENENTVDMASLAPSGGVFNIPALPDGETVDNRFTLTARTKAEALKNLLAGIPEEHQAVAKQDREYLNSQLSKFTGQGSCHADNNSEGWILRGLKSQLKNYQVTGVGWMRENEGPNATAQGGILGDAMGLGKTVRFPFSCHQREFLRLMTMNADFDRS